MLFWALIYNEAEREFMPLVEACVAYETNMDMAIILLQGHCLMDLINGQKNIPFCDEFQNLSKILSLYNWNNP